MVFAYFRLLGRELDFAPVTKIGALVRTSSLIYDMLNCASLIRRNQRKKNKTKK